MTYSVLVPIWGASGDGGLGDEAMRNGLTASSPNRLIPSSSAPHYTAVPNALPIAAVAAIASAPQNVTRTAPRTTLAPPARAARAPSSARKSSESAATSRIRLRVGRERSDHAERQRRADGERRGRRQRGLDRPRAERLGDAEFVARVRAERVVRHQLLRHLLARARGRGRA